MNSCNRGEKLTRSVQENAANRTAATRARALFCERPELFISFAACDNRGSHASNFLAVRAARTLHIAAALLGTLAGLLDLSLEDDMTFVGSQRFRGCACAHLLRPFGV